MQTGERGKGDRQSDEKEMHADRWRQRERQETDPDDMIEGSRVVRIVTAL